MNMKLVISTVLAAVLPVSSVFATGFTETSVELTQGNKGLVVSGKVDLPIDKVVIKVMAPGYAESTENTKVKGVSVIDMHKKNAFSETFKFPNELESGRYYIYLSGDESLAASETLELWYQQEDDKAVLITEIYNGSDLFDDYDLLPDGESYDRADKLSLKNKMYKNGIYDQKVSAMMSANKSMDYDVLKSNFNVASAIAAFENNSFDWTDADNKLSVNIWNDNDLTMGNVQKHFNSTLSTAGRQEVIDSLSNGRTYQTFTDFNNAFAKETIYNGIYNSQEMGYGHYPTLISELATASGQDFSAYLSLGETEKNDVGSMLLQANAADFDTMMIALNDIINGLGTPTTEDTNTGSGGGGGGGGNPVISGTPPVYIPGVSQTPSSSGEFSDIGGVEWAKEAIESLKEKNIISGTGEGKFEPDRAVKREEFIKMLITALEIEIGDNAESFSDVDKSAWYAPYISAALNLDITSGMGDGSFGIGASLTREQCCTFIYRACKDRDFSGEEKEFKDADKVSEFAKESVKALSSAGIIVGDEEGNFNPTDKITRAQTAVMIHRLISGGNAQ